MFAWSQRSAIAGFVYKALGFSAWIYFFTEAVQGSIPSARLTTLLAGGVVYAGFGHTKFGKPKQETQI
jgi:hypothetical protein